MAEAVIPGRASGTVVAPGSHFFLTENAGNRRDAAPIRALMAELINEK
jgi:hypothetical protein